MKDITPDEMYWMVRRTAGLRHTGERALGNKLALKVSFEDTLEDAHVSLSTTSVSQ
jgi:hypothetical protein